MLEMIYQYILRLSYHYCDEKYKHDIALVEFPLSNIQSETPNAFDDLFHFDR